MFCIYITIENRTINDIVGNIELVISKYEEINRLQTDNNLITAIDKRTAKLAEKWKKTYVNCSKNNFTSKVYVSKAFA